MSVLNEKIGILRSEAVREQLVALYGDAAGMTEKQTERYIRVLEKFNELYPEQTEQARMISAPGRTEIGGNHTDHNKGKVLAASVNLDALAAVAPRKDLKVRLLSTGYPMLEIDLEDMTLRPEEKGTTAALIRGVAAGMAQKGYVIGGFDAVVDSTVASGSGLSSSAAFEVMLTAILDDLYNGFVMPFVERAVIGQYAENEYFGKPCGLLDQMASAAGGLVTVDFGGTEPKVHALQYDFAAKGYALAVVSTGGSHANLTDHYAAIPAEMKSVAAELGGTVLRDVDPAERKITLKELRSKVGDRAVLRAMHFYAENDRVDVQVQSLEKDDLKTFLDAIIDSGRSSFMYLQNVYAFPEDQSLSLALCLAEDLLKGKGAWRIHGGGFAGTTLNFVPKDRLDQFVAAMEEAFGEGCCTVLAIRPVGAKVIRI